jgi:EAL domain-containing protein (putative c-di-GMP-specific phosphodiesterase class I)
VPPGRFISVAEETGLILPIGEWALRTACEQNKRWRDLGIGGIPVAVNLSAKQFSRGLVDTVGRVLAETELDPELLELELTESLSMEDPEDTIEILHRLEAMKVRLAIDDFGTGYSNLGYLRRFPVHKLKLDQMFVRGIVSNPDDLAIAQAVIAMGHSLRLRVVAEGVETADQLALLSRHDCDQMQGYYFSRPLPADACEPLLRERPTLPVGKTR